MHRVNILLVALALVGFHLGFAQTTVLDQTLLTQESFSTFTPVSVAGSQSWYFSAAYGAVCSGYSGGQSNENEDWLISPAINLSDADNVQLTFNHTRGSMAVMNAGVADGWYKAFASANFTGNPLTTEWIELTGLNQNITTAWQYVSSGSLTIPDAAKSAQTHIAFRYISSASQSATWEIKNVKVTAEIAGTNPDTGGVFKITNWNTEWLGCTDFGPGNENQQLENVATALLAINADIYCLQEVINTTESPSVAALVAILGSDEWGGAIVPFNTGDCTQRQALIYKKSRVQLGTSLQLSNGNAYQSNSYTYNWSGGRYPAVYNVNLIAGSNLIPVTLVNIHAKAEDNEASSYTRRLGAADALKTILDGAAYNTKNVIVIGDYNDYLTGTTSESCQCTDSPYKNFMDDENSYTGLTQNIVDAHYNWNPHPIIENIIISDELADNYIANSAAQEVTLPQTIPNFYATTSDHLPVSARFEFSTLGTATQTANAIGVYPNPVKDILNVSITRTDDTAVAEIYDISGRMVIRQKLSDTAINVSVLPAGIYIVKAGGSSAKFVKQ